MKRLRALLLLPLLLALVPEGVDAQASRGAPVPFVGFALGGSGLPIAFQGCGPHTYPTGEIRAGLSWGVFALEGRGAWMGILAADQCLLILAEEQRLPGTGPAVEYPFERGDMHTATDLRLRYAASGKLPLVVAGGAGWLAPQGVPYLVTSAGLRTRGTVRLALDLDQTWYRVPYDAVVREYGEIASLGPVLSSSRHHDWRAGLGVRLGMEVLLR